MVLRLTKFTVELEKDGIRAFLDILLRRKDDGSLDVTVYRKPVHTDWYLNIQPRHPSYVERGLILCLYDRAKSITISQNNLRKDDHITEVLKWNVYPGAFILCCSSPPPGLRKNPGSGTRGERQAPFGDATLRRCIGKKGIAGLRDHLKWC